MNAFLSCRAAPGGKTGSGRQNYDYYQTWNAAVSDLTSQGPPTTASSTAPIVTVSIPLLSRVTQPARIFAP
jgi:hypothetical protein